MRASKLAISVVALSLGLGLAACAEETNSESAATSDENGPIKLGAVIDITGPGASLAEDQKLALEMRVEQLNADGGIAGRQIELLIEDNQSTEDGAARATTKLLQSADIDILLGASRTGPSLAMRPLAEQAQIPMISFASNVRIYEGSEWVYSVTQSNEAVIDRIVEDMAAKGYTRIGLIRDASGFGEGVGEHLEAVGGPHGIEVVTEEKFAPDATDYTSQVVNVRRAEPDAVLIWGIPPAASLAQDAYDQLGVDKPIYHSHGIGNDVFLETVTNPGEEFLAPLPAVKVAAQLPDDHPQKEAASSFVEDFEAKYGREPSHFGGIAYDAMLVLEEVIPEVGTDAVKVRDAIMEVSDMPGANGIFTFTPDNRSGLDLNSLVWVTVEDGGWKLIEE